MKYFIGVSIPKNYKSKIEMLRVKFRLFTTEPHITIVPPPALPDEDIFIEKIIEICKNTMPFSVNLSNLGQFGSRVLYVQVYSPGLINLYDNIYKTLNLKKEKRGFTPHLTIVKQRPKKHPINIEKAKKLAEVRLSPYPEFTLNSITIYYQPKKRFIYIPYMEIPLGQ
jgi:2'-5' RNA ligase